MLDRLPFRDLQPATNADPSVPGDDWVYLIAWGVVLILGAIVWWAHLRRRRANGTKLLASAVVQLGLIAFGAVIIGVGVSRGVR